MSILIKGCAVLDDTQPDGYLSSQNVLIEGNRISKITSANISEQGIDRVLEGKDRLAIPGLVNAHTHSLENFSKATKEKVPLELWLLDLFLLEGFSPREIYLAAMLGAMEMLKTGTTAVLDHLALGNDLTAEALSAAMQAYADSGIRGGVAPLIQDNDQVMQAAVAARPALSPLLEGNEHAMGAGEYVELLDRFFRKWHRTEGGRLLCFAGPSGFQWCSDELLQGSLDVARRHGGGWHMHLLETKLQAMVCFDLHGKSATAAMKEQGLLGPEVSLAHSVWLDEADLDVLAESNSRVVHNPASNLRIGSGFAPIMEMLERGIKVALGTDGSASSDNQIMFDAMKLAGLIHNLRSTDHHRWPSSRDVVRMATANGAAALGMQDDLGELESGKLADIVLLDTSTLLFTPFNDVFRHLSYAENGSSVHTVIVDGRVVVEDGRVLTVDEQSIAEEAREAWGRMGSELPALRQKAEPLVREFEQYQQEMIGREFYLNRY
ncbi:MAG TPA: amidohydrolase [Anaerolineae bacterium]|nr:amidohydrolase [Anaerolineae bacterium]